MCFQNSNTSCLQDKKCKICFEKSFASVDKSKFWSDKNIIRPLQIKKQSHKKFWFICEFGHNFEMALSDAIRSWCPYPCCSFPAKKLCSDDKCNICLNFSFASHEKSSYWSKRNNEDPINVFKNSGKQYWFKCDYGHEFEKKLDNITKGSWCPYPCCCISSQKLCENIKCQVCFKASFSSHSRKDFWSNKNILKPREVAKNSKKKYWFICENKHEFDSSLDNINNGKWCPQCTFWKNQQECLEIIQNITNKQFRQSKPKFLKGLELDGFNEELRLGIEYNGKQHYVYNDFFHQGNEENLIKQQERDKLKQELCEKNNIKLIIVPYWIMNKREFISQFFQD